MSHRPCLTFLASLLVVVPAAGGGPKAAPTLEKILQAEGAERLATAARTSGDAARGAQLFHQAQLACSRCHRQHGTTRLGPDLARPVEKVADAYLVESILLPSKTIRKGFETVTVVTTAGVSATGLLVRESPKEVVLRDPARDFAERTIAAADIDSRLPHPVSIMPAGLANLLANRQQFLDLARYVIEIAELGPVREEELRPLETALPLPAYELDLDHAGLIAEADKAAVARGEKVYRSQCVQCHGTKDQPGSLPTSLAFAKGEFKNGNDPHAMYRTLTHGFGMMAPQVNLVPRQKYDVIHYIREAYVKPHNPSQYFKIDAAYLANLPRGKSRGPAPAEGLAWTRMDYGPSMLGTVELGRTENFAYKGIAVRLDAGPGGIARGNHWVVYDHDTMRVAGAWSGAGFVDWKGIHFNGDHGVHPRTVGRIHLSNPAAPGWADPAGPEKAGAFADPRLVGRDGKRYGPLPRAWSHYKGLYHHGDRVVVAYTVGTTKVLEMPSLAAAAPEPILGRTFEIGPRDRDMILQVAHLPGADAVLEALAVPGPPGMSAATFGPKENGKPAPPPKRERLFDGRSYMEAKGQTVPDLAAADGSLAARIRTTKGGTIYARTAPGAKWVPDGLALFVQGGRVVFDIGWVGAVRATKAIADGRWHDVVLTWEHQSGRVALFVDGALTGHGKLRPKGKPSGQVVRVGFGAPNFPRPLSHFDGDIAFVRQYGRVLTAKEIAAGTEKLGTAKLQAHWVFDEAAATAFRDRTGNGGDGRLVVGRAAAELPRGRLVAAMTGDTAGMQWLSDGKGNLRLRVPRGERTLRFTVFHGSAAEQERVSALAAAMAKAKAPAALEPLTRGGPPRWGKTLETRGVVGKDDGPFAVDVLTHPENDPWNCRLRFSGIDFLPDGDGAVLCTWDGDVWTVQGLAGLRRAAAKGEETAPLRWRRIASGLFQPLGLRIVAGRIYVSCRDQIVLLRDLNGDGETDYYENFNNDHQVTDHFHEFAMDLQTDAAGNFYYARAARHAKTALVPHHGTLLRVSPDGSRTEILATGFRAPNGVCLNPDGTFFLTDQEGHWHPKNRLNWVQRGGFYGNMMGYHDVTDSSDDAMKPPLAWITNRFDRSPSEMLWVPKETWGPLGGSLLNLSYGYGKIFLVPHERVNGTMQGGMVALPIPGFPTGTMRGRFHPEDGALYLCGMNAWGSNQPRPGGLFRVRFTGRPLGLPLDLHAGKETLTLRFTEPLDPAAVSEVRNWRVKVWSLKRSARYGSQHHDERVLTLARAELEADGRTVRLTLPDLAPTWCMEVIFAVRSAAGDEVRGKLHNTIHALGK